MYQVINKLFIFYIPYFKPTNSTN